MRDSTRNLTDLLEQAATDYGSRRFAVETATGASLPFAALRVASEFVASTLVRRFRVQPGQNVALLLPNCIEMLPAFFGILRAGCVAVPIDARLKSDELQFILGDCDAQAVFVHPATWKTAQDALRALRWDRPVIATGFGNCPPGMTPFSDVARGTTISVARPSATRSDVAVLLYTAGTTGRPKGAMLTHGNILFNIESAKAGHGLCGSDVHLLSLPMFYGTGLNTIMATALDQGASLVISPSTDCDEMADLVSRHACTTFFGVPTTFYLLFHSNKFDAAKLRSLRLIAYSGAPMLPATIQSLREHLPQVELHNSYGLTETRIATILKGEASPAHSGSVGRPVPDVEVAIFDDADNLLPSGKAGEVCVRGPGVFRGYYRRTEATADALRQGWFHTGDTAYMDRDGYVYLCGRKKDMISVAGEHVYPMEVEHVFCSHPAVHEAAVFGRPDPELGEIVHAAIVPRPGTSVTEAGLRAFAAERLASYKLPRVLRIVEKLPRNSSGKVLKRDL